MSPQVMKWEPYGVKTDVWSTGMVFVNVMTLEHPHFINPATFDNINLKDIPISNADLEPLRKCICNRMLVRDEKDRATVEEVSNDDAFQNHFSICEDEADNWQRHEKLREIDHHYQQTMPNVEREKSIHYQLVTKEESVEMLRSLVKEGNFKNVENFLRKLSKNVAMEIVNMKISIQTPGENDNLESTFLILASFLGHFEIVKLFVDEFNADIHMKGSVMIEDNNNEIVEEATPLWAAAKSGNLKIVETLIQKGANVNATTKTKSTPLRAACFNGHLDVVQLLIKEGADVSIANVCGNTCLMVASFNGYLEIVKFLIQSGADINSKEIDDWTALQIAVRNGHFETVKFLIQSGADINSKTKFNGNALEIAIRNEHSEIADVLCSHMRSDSES